MMYSGDENYDDAVTSGAVIDEGPIQIGDCAVCGGNNVVEREERDDSVGYHSTVLWCLDCNGEAD